MENNPTNYRSDLNSEEQIIMSDAMLDMEEFENQCDMIAETPCWIENADGSGQWSDEWDGDDRHPGGEYEPERDHEDDILWIGSKCFF